MGVFGSDFSRDENIDALDLSSPTSKPIENEHHMKSAREEEIERSILEDYSTNLRYSRMELDHTLRALELKKPDYSSPDYASWAEQREELLQRLKRIGSKIIETDEMLIDMTFYIMN